MKIYLLHVVGEKSLQGFHLTMLVSFQQAHFSSSNLLVKRSDWLMNIRKSKIKFRVFPKVGIQYWGNLISEVCPTDKFSE
jgi:hypothetical protein